MLLFIVFVITVIVAYNLRQWFKVWRFSEQFPGTKTLPIIGNAHELGNNPYDYLQYLYKQTIKNKFEAFRLWVGPSLYVILTNADDCEVFLSSNKHLDKFNDYRFLQDWIGLGLITINGPIWFRQRRLITPAFHFNILKEFHLVMNSGVKRLANKLNKYADAGKTFDVQHLVNLATLDVICETAMGVEVNALEDPESDMVQAFHDVSVVVYHRIFSAWKRFDLLFSLSKDYQINQKALHVLHSFNQKVITQRKAYLTETINQPDEIERKKKAFLDILLTSTFDNGQTLSDREISDEVSTFIFAGHDTTAAAISFGIYNLATNPKDQQKVYEEQLSICGTDLDYDPTYQDLQDMVYLDMFVKESQRLMPAVAFIGRNADEDIKLTSGKTIPKGTSVGILLYAMGHNPKVFENPMVFNPDRFLTENRSLKNPYEYVPFSAGPRNCIGQKFANNEIRTVLARLVRNFEILPSDEPFEPKFGATATLRAVDGIMIRLRRRPNNV